MNVHEIEFNGALLRRGFWIYLWLVTTDKGQQLVYVGRTGDSSSPNAQSPFRRVGQHVDPNPKSKSNALARNLGLEKIDPATCQFKFVAFGPIYEERDNMEEHVPVRDRTGAFERKMADWFKEKGYQVLGTHPREKKVDEKVWNEIERELSSKFSR
jgi:hypothetical protein